MCLAAVGLEFDLDVVARHRRLHEDGRLRAAFHLADHGPQRRLGQLGQLRVDLLARDLLVQVAERIPFLHLQPGLGDHLGPDRQFGVAFAHGVVERYHLRDVEALASAAVPRRERVCLRFRFLLGRADRHRRGRVRIRHQHLRIEHSPAAGVRLFPGRQGGGGLVSFSGVRRDPDLHLRVHRGDAVFRLAGEHDGIGLRQAGLPVHFLVEDYPSVRSRADDQHGRSLSLNWRSGSVCTEGR